MLFVVAVISACAAVIVPLEHKYATDPVQKAARGEISALGDLSLIRADNAARALAAVQAKSPAESRVQDLTLRPTHADIDVVVPADGSEHRWLVDVGFNAADDTSDATQDYGKTFRQFDMTVPERITRAVLAQLHRPESDVDYITTIITQDDPSFRWELFLQHGRIRDRTWLANADGSDLHRNG